MNRSTRAGDAARACALVALFSLFACSVVIPDDGGTA